MRTPGFVLLFTLSAATLTGQVCPDGRPLSIAIPAPDETQEVTLEGGSRYLGRVLHPGDPVRFELLSGDVLELRRERIRCLRLVAGERREGGFWPEDPNRTRLFFGPTGRALPAGEGYLSVFEVFMPFVAVGLTDRVTFAGGFPLFLAGTGIEIFWLAPKVEVVRTPHVRGSVGLLAFFGASDAGSAGVLYGVATIGRSSDAAMTAGLGWGYSTDHGIHEAPVVMIGFEGRSSRSVKLISENYLFPEEGFGILSLGPRFFGEKLSADLGLGLPFGRGVGGPFIFPLVNFVYNW